MRERLKGERMRGLVAEVGMGKWVVRMKDVGQRGLENHEWGKCEREGVRRMRRGLKGRLEAMFFSVG